MKYIDMHCDTLLKTAIYGNSGDLFQNEETAVDFKRMKKGGQLAQFFAIFLLGKEEDYLHENITPQSDDEFIDGRLKCLTENLSKYSDIIQLARNYDELKANEKAGKMSAFLTMEEGRPVDGSFEKLRRFYSQGFRLITLTWNYENCFGFPNSFDPVIMEKGLKDFGKEAIQLMEELGMLVDVSHLSDGGFYDVAKILKKPFVASHSNAREITPHPRNLTDEMIKILAEKGGIAGLNFCPVFLKSDQTGSDNRFANTGGSVMTPPQKKIVFSKIEDMILHLNHMRNKGGEDFVALGSDLDGIGGELDISASDEFYKLFGALQKEGWTEDQIEKLAYKNVERVIREVLK